MLSLLLASTLLTLATAQLADLPVCAQSCFISAVSNSSCGLTDYYCQCTTGAKVIETDVVSCLCHSTCTTSDLLQVEQASNGICSSALAASSQSYTPATIGLGACATASASSGSKTAASTSATATSSGAASDSSASASSAGSSNTAASASATPSSSSSTTSTSGGQSVVVLQGAAVLAVAGLAALVL